MRWIFFTIALFLFIFDRVEAQCPPASAANVHVVQRGETLFSIARKYKISVADLCKWNNRRQSDVLEMCTQLTVAAGRAAPQSEKVDSQPAPKAVEQSAEPRKPFQFYVKQSGGQHVVQYGETVENIARLYGYTEEYFRHFNQLSSGAVVAPGTVLRSTDCSCPEKRGISTPDESDGATVGSVGIPAVTYATSSFSGHSALARDEEMEMVREINLLRSNPSGYIRFVEEYLQSMHASDNASTLMAAAKELIEVLDLTPPLSELQPLECVYQAAKKHGQDQLRLGTASHQGSDGSWPWERVLRECPHLQDGNENLVGGAPDVRRAVILLLIDDGVADRADRETLLNPHWKYVACFKIGQIGEVPNCWVQKFAM